ncbi:hypothetical protein [Porphyrobacter sp. AAP60]|uniref:hypothetical protein n=1 Tax=Porphyrobacter sp. AAP60 TaxID=1523423 RepID=UPI0006B96C4E|nr:hypothetical protein [Porphyrobacter sp. AAP60]KPF62441.1 hypothetical protein IP79_12690 [Porphyrobacter sp. AAP60]
MPFAVWTNAPCTLRNGAAGMWPSGAAFVLLGAAAALPCMAQESETDASASLIQPLVINGAQPLEFGTLAIPPQGECVYELDVAGRTNAPGGICQFIGGDRFAARFTLSCAASALVQYQMIHTNTAPAGAEFSAPSGVMEVDGAGPGPAFQTLPCDTDGISEVAGAGRLIVRAGTVHGFTGAVGTIRLEVAYD